MSYFWMPQWYAVPVYLPENHMAEDGTRQGGYQTHRRQYYTPASGSYYTNHFSGHGFYGTTQYPSIAEMAGAGNRSQQPFGGGFDDSSRGFGTGQRQQQQARRFDLSSLGAALPDPSSHTKSFPTQDAQIGFARHPTTQQGGSGHQSQEHAPLQPNQFPFSQDNMQSLPTGGSNPGPSQQLPRQAGLTQDRLGVGVSPNVYPAGGFFAGPGALSQLAFTSNRPQQYGSPGRQGFQEQAMRQADTFVDPMASLFSQSTGLMHIGPSPYQQPIQPPSHLGPIGANRQIPTAAPSLSSPRGPPRKPKQSGYALWVGNLPPATRVTDLKEHFSKEAKTTIESVFLISKSNCAFVNYRTEDACIAAMTRFHESRFHGVRLVCRLRRTGPATAVSPVPTGPAVSTAAQAASQTAVESIFQNRESSARAEEQTRLVDGVQKVPDKYFIVKSLTLEDLELSSRNGIWATQAHNEEGLNRAYETADNVYLIFSANKSGEYFGYARMASPIDEESASKLDWTPRTGIVEDVRVPRSIPTPETENAPKGRIIDDSARGTIFWEAIGDNAEDREADTSGDEVDVAGTAQAFGKPFKIQWLSTNRLPFYRTRGLRNPWNANREVKIARDGTELEPTVGRRLLEMFNRSPTAPLPLGTGSRAQMGMGYGPPLGP